MVDLIWQDPEGQEGTGGGRSMSDDRTTRNPWLADASEGATGLTYEIRTVADFLKVPPDRRRVCLREFDAWMAVQEGTTDMLCAAGEHAITPADLRWHNDVYRWVDDGKATISVEMRAAPPAVQVSPFRFKCGCVQTGTAGEGAILVSPCESHRTTMEVSAGAAPVGMGVTESAQRLSSSSVPAVQVSGEGERPNATIKTLRLVLEGLYAHWCRQSSSSRPQLLNAVYGEWHHPEDQFVADGVKRILADTAAVPAVPASQPSDFKALASAMRKMLPPALLSEVVAHLDPLTPFVAFLKESAPHPPPRTETRRQTTNDDLTRSARSMDPPASVSTRPPT